MPIRGTLGVVEHRMIASPPGTWSSANSAGLRTSMRSGYAGSASTSDAAARVVHGAFIGVFGASLEQRRERRPDVVEHLRLRAGSGWMRSGWNIESSVGEALEQERHQRGLARAGDVAEGRVEALARKPRRNSAAIADADAAARASRHSAPSTPSRRDCSRIASRLPPRSPSLPPSSMIVIAGRCCASSAPSRARPPAVVSPLMLALTTRYG